MNHREQQHELKKGLEKKSLSVQGVHAALLSQGRIELRRSWKALGWSGFAAGISMGLSLLAEGVLHAYLPEAGWRSLISSFGYSMGFLVVMLGRQQLYTETTLTAFLPFLHERTLATLMSVLRLWAVVLIANLLGSLLFAWAVSLPTAAGAELQQAFAEISFKARDHSPGSAFLRAIFGGWIIALTVWLLPAAETARIWIIILMTYLLAAAQLTHIIAGSLEYFYGIVTAQVSWGSYWWGYFIPVLVGNSIGGIVFVATLNHAQSVSGEPEIP